MTYSKQHFLPLSLTLLVVLIDRLSKVIVTETMEYGSSIPVLGDWLRWTYIHNDGMVFGMELISVSVLGWLSLVAVVVILYILMRTPSDGYGSRWVLAAILGGAIGNTYDRIMYGYVIDFVDVDLPGFITGMDRWPVFNVADMGVSVGVTLLVLYMLLPRKQLAPEGGIAPAEPVVDPTAPGGLAVDDGTGEPVSESEADSPAGQPVERVETDLPQDEGDNHYERASHRPTAGGGQAEDTDGDAVEDEDDADDNASDEETVR